MRSSTYALACATFSVLLLSACSGGSSGNGPPVNNPAPTATLSANPTSIVQGGSSTLTWSSTNATSCNASGGTFAGAKATSGNELVTNIQAPTTYSIVCSGAGGNSPTASASVAVSAVSTANAGVSRTVFSGSTVLLTGEASIDPEGDTLQYAWTQTGGAPTVTLTGANTVNPTFTAPTVASNTALTFSLTVSDGSGTSAPSVVTITVAPVAAGNVLVTGRVTFVRIPFATNTNVGLNYASPVNRPARGVVVRATNAGMQTQLAIGETDSDGNYALSVPQNTSIDVYAVARMSRDNTVPLPRWSYQVSDVDALAAPYTFTDVAFNSAAGVAHNLSIPSGYNSSGSVTGTRASAPFAILDTLYTATQAVLGVAPATNFPALGVDWAIANPGGQTFFDPGTQRIVLSADAAEDTDEFDQHVIAHEYGHYIEFNFSRADNIGGSHGIGDKLDIRVAFGEGFGYAFAGIVLKDPVARDSFVNGGAQVSSTFNIETNPPTNPPGSPSGNFGCWCSESSVWSILWDLYDSNADSNDTVALGFQPLWGVLIGEQRTTPAMTSIFSFISALKTAQPGRANAIDALIAAQNITGAGIDAFASTETHVPSGVSSASALPVYTTVTSGGQVSVLSGADAGHYNTLGNHRFIRYNKSGSASQTVTVTTPNSDPDVIVYRNGAFQQISQGAANETFNITVAGTYIFDVYDCANGCSDIEGTAGDFTVTLGIN
jgi:K319-like protein